MDIHSQLMGIFVEVLGLERENVDWEELKYRSIPEWDSVGHMALVAEIEDHFDIMLDTDDVIGMSSFRIAVETVGRFQSSCA